MWNEKHGVLLKWMRFMGFECKIIDISTNVMWANLKLWVNLQTIFWLHVLGHFVLSYWMLGLLFINLFPWCLAFHLSALFGFLNHCIHAHVAHIRLMIHEHRLWVDWDHQSHYTDRKICVHNKWDEWWVDVWSLLGVERHVTSTICSVHSIK